MISPQASELLTTAESLEATRKELRSFEERGTEPLPSPFWDELASVKTAAIAQGDQDLAAAIWCFETIGKAQDAFVSSFRFCKVDEFYHAWCELEKCEIQLSFLGRHYVGTGEEFGLPHIQAHVPRLQELFPYQFFLSPGFIVREVRCSICNTVLTLRRGCDHEVGEIYNGRMCGRKITRAVMLEVSIVTNPVQKYSVLFSPELEYNYGPVKYVIDGLRSPWHGWRTHQIDRPDGGIHINVMFDTPPPDDVAEFVEKVKHFVTEPLLKRRAELGGE